MSDTDSEAARERSGSDDARALDGDGGAAEETASSTVESTQDARDLEAGQAAVDRADGMEHSKQS